LIKIVLILVIFISSSFSCGGGFWPEDYQFRFIHKRNYEFTNISGNLNYSSVYNSLISDYEKKIKEKNIDEWYKEFKNKFTKKQIEEFIYENKNIYKIKNKEIVEYLNFLEEQEPFVATNRWYYYKKKKIDKKKVSNLIDKALNRIDTLSSSYLKLRYFFLAIRLSHYNNVNNPIEIFNNYKYLLENTNSFIKDWIQGQYAGSLIKEGKTIKGVYEFTKLFGKDKLNWHLAYYNFKYIKTDKQWTNLIKLAKNDEEKIKFYSIRALNINANIIEELKNIESINKNSKFFDLLLFRKLLNSQEFFDIPMWGNKKENKEDYKPFIKYLETIKKDKMYMINLSLAYFYFYENDLEHSSLYLKKAYESVEGENVHELNILSYIIYLNSINYIDKKDENEIAQKLNILLKQSCNNRSVHRYTFHKIKDIYKNQGDTFKYYLSKNINYIDINSITLNKYEKFQALFHKKNKTNLEKYIINKINNKYFEKELKSAYIKILMNNLNFEKVLSLIKPSNIKLKFNIFNNYIKGNNRVFIKNKYTLYDTVKKLIEIQNNLKINPNNPMDNYLYANAMYNLSFWGNSNILTSVYKSTYYFKEKQLEKNKINLSIKHFKKALENSKNKEFRAKIVYMLAKSELALYEINNSKERNYNSYKSYEPKRAYSWNREKSYEEYISKGFGNFFEKLKKEYSSTFYYKELLQECGNLNLYNKTIKKSSN